MNGLRSTSLRTCCASAKVSFKSVMTDWSLEAQDGAPTAQHTPNGHQSDWKASSCWKKWSYLVFCWWTLATCGKEEVCLGVRLTGRLLTEEPFAMAAAPGAHSSVGMTSLCQHSLPSTALVDASSRSPLEGNKREMLYTLMTFPQ